MKASRLLWNMKRKGKQKHAMISFLSAIHGKRDIELLSYSGTIGLVKLAKHNHTNTRMRPTA